MIEIDLPRLYERDIDVLLQEEMMFNEQVRAIFASALDLLGPMQVERCGLSVVDSTGETDLFVICSAGTQRGALLIENKIDAEFQPLQPERYCKRAAILAREGGINIAHCALIAPALYLDACKSEGDKFDAAISYEDLARVIAAGQSARSTHRSVLILRAIEQARKAYVLIPDQGVTGFWDRIYKIASNGFPDLAMKAPSEKGGGSNWVIFKGDLPSRITVDWKVRKGTIDLSFWKGAVHQPPLAMDLKMLGVGAIRRLLGETTVIQMQAPRASEDWTRMTDDAITEALTIARRLHEFYWANWDCFVSALGTPAVA